MKTIDQIIEQHKPHGEYNSYYHETQIEDMMKEFAEQHKPKWVKCSKRLPEIDQKDEFKARNLISVTVPVIENGVMNLGFYNYPLDSWQVNGRLGNINVTEWFELPTPPTE